MREGLTACPRYARYISNDREQTRTQTACCLFRWAMRMALPLVMLIVGGNVLAAQTGGGNAGAIQSVNVFMPVPAGKFSGAQPAGASCSVDLVNDTAAQSAAIDHLGSVSFKGWAGDRATGRVPSVVSLVLVGTTDFYVRAHTGGDRPDVAAVLHDPAFARSGFQVSAYLPGIPVGDYGITIYYRVEGKEMVCPTNITVSVQ